ncbi:MAG: 16S rRNA (cytidine(1402)-2'-O)-methyltransferase [Clostridiales bacterium]|nr:16S rRNA (cytidine(1402)-2'-O)-methyltransferase [Clostridiales bacterium]
MAGTLYLVPTPIGNLGDISSRIADTLNEADFIAAEDTRVSLKLLNHLGIRKPLVSYYRHNVETSGPAIVNRLLEGESCALVTDAGTPAISDPGEDLVRLCAEAGIPVVAIPGPCALVTALAVSGLPTGRFTFEGFLATNKKNRRAHLDALRRETRTMIFYEAPHKLCATLSDLQEAFGPQRRVALCRELTKLHEEVRRTTLGEACAWYRENPPRGEFVLVVEGAEAPEEAAPLTLEEGAARVRQLQETQGLRLKDAARQVAQESGLPKNELYQAALARKGAEE